MMAGLFVVVVVKIMSARQSPVPRAALWWLAPVGLCGPLSTVLVALLSIMVLLALAWLWRRVRAFVRPRRDAAAGG